MMYRPSEQGELVERALSLAAIDRIDTRHMAKAMAMAKDFWTRGLAEALISEHFKRIARNHCKSSRRRVEAAA